MDYSSRPPRHDYSARDSRPSSRDDYAYRSSTSSPPKDEAPFVAPPPSNSKIDFDKYDEIPVEASGRDCPPPIEAWKDADLGSVIMRNIEAAKYDRPTPVQKNSLPIVLKGRDLMGCAQTGSGKTAAFLLPIIAQLMKKGPPHSTYQEKAYPLALVLAPTRELASQIVDEAKKFSHRSGLRCVVVYGGTPIGGHLRELSRGCEILVATPGRLVDIMERGRVSLSAIRHLVLDEADRMLDMGFEPQIRKIVEQADMPRTGHRQTLMFSATFAKDIQRLAATFLTDYVFLAVGRVGSTTDFITQKFIKTNNEMEKQGALMQLLANVKGLTLIFVETKKKASQLDYSLNRKGLPVSSIHGDKAQTDRTTALKNFSMGRTPILIATNVAARGLDISNVAHVINYDMPNNIDDYVHRIGRTGRAGKTGISTAFLGEEDAGIIGKLLQILHETGQEIPPWLEELNRGKFFAKKSKPGFKFGGKDFRLKQGYSNGSSGGFGGGASTGFSNGSSGYGGSSGSYGNSSGGYGGQSGDYNRLPSSSSMPQQPPRSWTPLPPPSSVPPSTSSTSSTATSTQPNMAQYNPYYMQYYGSYYGYPTPTTTTTTPSTTTSSTTPSTTTPNSTVPYPGQRYPFPPTSYPQYNGYSGTSTSSSIPTVAPPPESQPVLFPQPPPPSSTTSVPSTNGTSSSGSHGSHHRSRDTHRDSGSRERDHKSSSSERYRPSPPRDIQLDSKRKYSEDSDDDHREKKHRSSHHSSRSRSPNRQGSRSRSRSRERRH